MISTSLHVTGNLGCVEDLCYLNVDRMTIKGEIVAVLCTVFACVSGANAQPASAPKASNFPVQLEMRVPFEPTAFPSAGRNYLTYELHLTNFAGNPLTLRRLEVFAVAAKPAKPIAAFEAEQLGTLLQPVGSDTRANGSSDRLQLAAGGSVVIFLWITFDRSEHIPSKLRHRIYTTDSTVEGAVIDTHHGRLHVLAPPVKGMNWLSADAPSNDPENHHRRGILVFDARAQISRRYAIDWLQAENGAKFSGDAADKHSYYAYGEPVLAVADGRVVTAKDGLPENVPRHNGAFRPAIPITLETVGGNTITLDLGGGQFAHYMHLQPGSLRVKAGDRVRRGQEMGRIGGSGDARDPHLHFEVTTSPRLLTGEGVPYLIDRYRVKSADGSWQLRTRELPLKDMLIDFGPRVMSKKPLRKTP